MDENNTAETIGITETGITETGITETGITATTGIAESTTGVREVLLEAGSGELNREVFEKVAVVAAFSQKCVEDLEVFLSDWDNFSKPFAKESASILKGYCLLLLEDVDRAQEVLKSQRRSEWGAYYFARAHMAKNNITAALKTVKTAHGDVPDSLALSYLLVDLYLKGGNVDGASEMLGQLKKADGNSTDFLYHSGLHFERTGEYHDAIESYRQTVARDPHYAEAYFRLGYLLDLHGTDADEANEEAVAAYESCVKSTPIHTNAVVNLALLYEDRERYHDAIKCYETVLQRFPNHSRANLYLGDAQASTRMFYDKDQERKADKHSQVLKIPVSDFELSVRSRNCLQKMDIDSLGDLIMKTEQELLSYKNFGETSLAEIKEMLGQKGLRLGQGLENKSGDVPSGRNPLEATASPEVLDRPIGELDLSVRSRRCMERLDVRTVRDLINKTEVELMSAKNFGMTSLNEIKRKLTELGMSLRS